MTGCVKRRSTLTTTVLSALSLTTMPCNSLFGIVLSLSLRLGRTFLRSDRLDAGDVATDFANARGLLQLPRRPLEAQVELLLLQAGELILQLVGRFGADVFGLHDALTRRCA